MDRLLASDKLGHVLAYFVLALLPALTETRLSTALHAAGIVVLGFVLEFWQSQFAGRSFDVGDLLANAVGVVAALAVTARRASYGLIQSKGA